MWSDLSARHLLALRAVVEEGTFGRAAERLGFTQSAVSQQIAALEGIVGETLFDRPAGPKPPTLTAAGELLCSHADVLIDKIEDAERDLSRFVRGIEGSLSIATFQSVSARVLPTALRQLYKTVPGLEVALQAEEEQEVRLEAARNGEVDVAFIIGDSPTAFDTIEGLEAIYIGADPHVALVPADTPPGVFKLSEISASPMVGQPATDTCGLIIDRALERHGVTPNYTFRSHDNGAVQGMVAAGVGVAVVPLLTVDTTDPEVSIRETEPALEPRHLALAWSTRRRRSPLARRFVEIAAESCGELLANARHPEAG